VPEVVTFTNGQPSEPIIEYVAFSVRISHLPRAQWEGFERRLREAVEAIHPLRPFSGDVEVELIESAGLVDA
jgi:hypothetical protein